MTISSRKAVCVIAVCLPTLLIWANLTGSATAAPGTTPPFTQCPEIGATPSCDILLVVNSNESISVLGDTAVGPYDGGDDTLVGIQNNSSHAIKAITVSGPNSDLAGFDGDGICTYAAAAGGTGFAGDGYCTSAQVAGTNPSDYYGPMTTYVLDPHSYDDVEVDFSGTGLAVGKSTYFSLEGALTAAVVKARQGGLSQGRYVALGDSVPYGHGLANPYPTPQVGLPTSAVKQGPSSEAYPALVATALNLGLNIRTGNCSLTGDDLTISGATAAAGNSRAGNDQCTNWSTSESVQHDELPAANLAQNKATLVTIQAGADDINFSECLKWELTKWASFHADGTQCVKNGAVTFGLLGKLGLVRSALAQEIEQISPDAKHIAVLNYYQPIPNPSDFKKASIFPNGEVDPVCWGLSHNLQGAYDDATIIQSALNVAIDNAVSDAHNAGVKNVQLIDLSNLESTHEMCTGNPALFSGEVMSKSEFDHDLQALIRCHVFFNQSCRSEEPAAEAELKAHSWRAAHPNVYGQQDIARTIEAAFPGL